MYLGNKVCSRCICIMGMRWGCTCIVGIRRSGMGSTCVMGLSGLHLGDGLYTRVKGVCSGGRVGCTLVKGVGWNWVGSTG